MRERHFATTLEHVREYESFEQFIAVSDIPEGHFVIPDDGYPVDFYYEHVANARTTLVFFHGAALGTVNLPWFVGKSISAGLEANRLAISDPSLVLDDSGKLTLSWFAGSTAQPNLQHFIETVIRNVCALNGTEHLAFIGGSGGGFAALEMSRRFTGSVVLAMNPQISIGRYIEALVNRYLELSWNGATSLSEISPYVIHDLIDAYPSVLNNTVAYVQNTRDTFHIEAHQIPFVNKVGEDPNVLMLMDAWGDPSGTGHVVPPHALVRNIVRRLVTADGDWGNALVECGFTDRTSASAIELAIHEAKSRQEQTKRKP